MYGHLCSECPNVLTAMSHHASRAWWCLSTASGNRSMYTFTERWRNWKFFTAVEAMWVLKDPAFKIQKYHQHFSLVHSKCIIKSHYISLSYFKGSVSLLQPKSNSVGLCRYHEYVTYVLSMKFKRLTHHKLYDYAVQGSENQTSFFAYFSRMADIIPHRGNY